MDARSRFKSVPKAKERDLITAALQRLTAAFQAHSERWRDLFTTG
jgi:hypothetical protein